MSKATDYIVKDIGLAEWGRKEIAIAETETEPPAGSTGGDASPRVAVRVHPAMVHTTHPLAAVRDLGPDPGNQRPQGDGRDHQAALRVVTDRRRRPAAGSEHPFEFLLGELGRAAEVIDEADQDETDGDVAHHLGGPGVDLGVGLLGETGAVLGGVG